MLKFLSKAFVTINNFSSTENSQLVLDFFPYFFFFQVNIFGVLCWDVMTHWQQKWFPLEPGPAHALTIHSLTADPLICSWSSFLDHFCPFDLQPVKQDQMHSSLTSPLQGLHPLDKRVLIFSDILKYVPAPSSVLYEAHKSHWSSMLWLANILHCGI